MKTESAIEFNQRLNQMYELVTLAYYGRLNEVITENFDREVFYDASIRNLATKFKMEFIQNLNTYENKKVVVDYMQLYIEINKYRDIDLLDNFNKTILSHETEVEFIFKTKKLLDLLIIAVSEIMNLNTGKLAEI